MVRWATLALSLVAFGMAGAALWLELSRDDTVAAADIDPAALETLRGPPGPTGEPGARGDAGPEGPAGPPGELSDDVSKDVSRIWDSARYLCDSLSPGARAQAGAALALRADAIRAENKKIRRRARREADQQDSSSTPSPPVFIPTIPLPTPGLCSLGE